MEFRRVGYGFGYEVVGKPGTYTVDCVLDMLQAENAKIRECLEFYAESENWCQLIGTQYNLGKIWVEVSNAVTSTITTENGKRARQCLKEIEGALLMNDEEKCR